MQTARRDAQLASSPSCCLGDWFDSVLAALAPADVAACRLVSRGWRAQVRVSLSHLTIARSAASEDVAAAASSAFPHLLSLRLELGGGAVQHGQPQPQPPGPPSLSAALRRYCGRLKSLRRLALEAPGSRGPTCLMCPGGMCALGGSLPFLESLSLSGFEVACDGASWSRLSRLGALELVDCSLRDAPGELEGECSYGAGAGAGCLMHALQPLAGLRRLALRGRVDWLGAGAGAGRARALAGISALAQLEGLLVDGDFCMPPEVWAEVVALPRLLELTFVRSLWAGHEFEEQAVTDRSLAQLADSAPQLRALALGGHSLISDAGLAHIARMTGLRALELRADCSSFLLPRQQQQGVTDQGLQQLSSLRGLQRLRLGGYPLREGGYGAVACMTALTSLHLRSCERLDDEGMHRLCTLRGLRALALVDCPKVSDIGVAFLMKHTTGLTSLDLSGNDRNLTDIGVASIARARGLRRLSLAHCQRVSEVGLAALLLRLEGLTHLSLRDCPRLGNQACALLATYTPQLESLDLEYCQGVGDKGITALAGLRRLHHVRVHEAGATSDALRSLMACKAGRRLRIDSSKPCWWLQSEE